MIKEIFFKGEISGRGIVNFDDASSQRFTLMKHCGTGMLNENVKLGKKSFYKIDEEKWGYKSKISADCLRHAIFEHDVDVANGMFVENDLVLANYVLSPVGVVRGYMYARKNDTLKRKSPLTIVDAIQINNEQSIIEVGSKAGERDAISFFYSEKAGDMKYGFNGMLDVKRLQFISADPNLERQAIKDDWLENINIDGILKNHYGEIAKPKVGYFSSTSKFTSSANAEHGILLNQEMQEYLIKKTLKDILAINITRSNAYAKTDFIKVKLVNDIVNDKFEDEDGWIELRTIEDVDALDLSNLENFFVEHTQEEIDMRNKMKSSKEENDKNTKEQKEASKKKKDENK